MAEAAAREAILEPDLPIIDPHHHLWDRQPAQIAALPPPRHGFDHIIRRVPRYLLHELLADMRSGHNIRATVFLECGAMYRADGPPEMRCIGETEFVNGVAAMGASGVYGDVRPCAGIVSNADCRLGDGVAAVLEAHVAAGNGRFRGIRNSCSYDPDPNVLGLLSGRTGGGLYLDATFRQGFSHLGRMGLSFDAWLLEPQLPDLIDLVRAFEGTTVIVDHVATPLGLASYEGRREERFPIWRDNMRELARSPNVNVKLGGLAMAFPNFPSFMSDPAAPSTQLAQEWRPYIESCIELFGPGRCMFESNFPVDIGSCDYATLWNAFKHIAKDYSAGDKAQLFFGCANRVYRLGF